jgi:hypothetical protein
LLPGRREPQFGFVGLLLILLLPVFAEGLYFLKQRIPFALPGCPGRIGLAEGGLQLADPGLELLDRAGRRFPPLLPFRMFRLQGVEGASQQVLQVILEPRQLALRLAQPLMNRMMTGWSGTRL